MKVYVSGAHSSGKSTIARYISKQYNLPFLPETARTILNERELQIDQLRCDLDIVDDYQRAVFDRQISEEKKHQEFCADRSILDILCYSGSHSRILPELLQRPELTEAISILKEPGSILFFVRCSEATLVSDGVREKLDYPGVVAIDAMIKLLLEMYQIRYFAINTTNMRERIKIVDNVLSLVREVNYEQKINQ